MIIYLYKKLTKLLLSKLPIGKKAIVKKILEEKVYLKTLEMGILPNTEIKIVAKAPLGDPICVIVMNTLLSLRVSEASMIEVEII